MDFFRRKKDDDDAPLDPNARSPQLGLKYKDLALLGQLMSQGADLTKPRHALYYLYFASRDIAEQGAEEARAARLCPARSATRFPSTPISGRWSASASTRSSTPPGVIAADDLFQGIADRHGAEFDGWEAAAKP